MHTFTIHTIIRGHAYGVTLSFGDNGSFAFGGACGISIAPKFMGSIGIDVPFFGVRFAFGRLCSCD